MNSTPPPPATILCPQLIHRSKRNLDSRSLHCIQWQCDYVHNPHQETVRERPCRFGEKCHDCFCPFIHVAYESSGDFQWRMKAIYNRTLGLYNDYFEKCIKLEKIRSCWEATLSSNQCVIKAALCDKIAHKLIKDWSRKKYLFNLDNVVDIIYLKTLRGVMRNAKKSHFVARFPGFYLYATGPVDFFDQLMSPYSVSSVSITIGCAREESLAFDWSMFYEYELPIFIKKYIDKKRKPGAIIQFEVGCNDNQSTLNQSFAGLVLHDKQLHRLIYQYL